MSLKKKQLGILAALIIGNGILWKLSYFNSDSETPTVQAEEATQTLAAPAELSSTTKPAPSAKPVETTVKKTPNKNLEDMTQTLFQFTRPETQLRDLVEYLEQTKQEPTVVHDTNPSTGEMAIVRTKSPLPGTRYFHAQYMTGENQKGFVQHMSFEFQPSETAMADAIASVQKSFPKLEAPEVKKEDFIRWSLDDNHILWIKKLNQADLQDNPFNAYTEADIGTIRVAVEAEVHGPEDSH